MNPLVSILIPVCNGSSYLAQCIDSALAQSYDNTEIVVVDDHSTDDSIALVLSYKNPKIRFFKNEGLKGVGHCWNTCTSMAQGDYYCFLHQDDCLHPDYLNVMLSEMLKIKATILYCPAYNVDKDFNKQSSFFNNIKYWLSRRNPRFTLETIKPLFMYDLIMCPTVFYDRNKMKQIGPYVTEYRTAIDYDMWFRIVLEGGVIQYVPKKLYYYRYHAEMETKKIRKDFTKYKEDFELKERVRNDLAKKGVFISRLALKKSIFVILFKDALQDLFHLEYLGCIQKILYVFKIINLN